MRLIRSACGIVFAARRAYVALNLLYYGLVLCGMIYASFNPSVQQSLLEDATIAFTEGPLSAVTNAYVSGEVVPATVLTFAVNLTVGSLVYITLPSLVIPFSGLALGSLRAVTWGVLMSPTTREMRLVMIPHSITLILEGQAYVLAMLAAYNHGRAFLWPQRVGAPNRAQGYWTGVKSSLRMYPLIALVLAVSAVYEVLEAELIISRFASTQ